ncbi:MAG TPA: hypothetical protein P5270_03035 [Victivallales bacterium]|nr:hypothetical protein [Victivallales bacterium]HRR28311.1 hypothetical protein [Victivallales bacterium]
MDFADSLADCNAGRSRAAKIAIIAITTSNSINVKKINSFFFVYNHNS